MFTLLEQHREIVVPRPDIVGIALAGISEKDAAASSALPSARSAQPTSESPPSRRRRRRHSVVIPRSTPWVRPARARPAFAWPARPAIGRRRLVVGRPDDRISVLPSIFDRAIVSRAPGRCREKGQARWGGGVGSQGTLPRGLGILGSIAPVEVVYCFPLPRDASLVSFQISGEGFSIASRLEPRAEAEKRYEDALEDGSLAAMTQQNLDGLVNLTVGNIRPGETVSVRLDLIAGLSLSDTGFRLRFPFTVAPCYHSQMRVSLDRQGAGIMELPDHVAGGAFLPPFHANAAQLHKIGFDLQIEPAQGVGEIASPSHAVRVLLHDHSGIGVKLSPDRDVPNRDLVLDVKRDWGVGQAWSDRISDGRRHFALVVPSSVFGPSVRTIRRVVFLLDRSGSMGGAPLKQGRAAIESCLAKLSPADAFGIVAFDNDSERFSETLLVATPDRLNKASVFLGKINARGGTELAAGVEAAADLFAGSPGEIFLITDGQVSETAAILARARKAGNPLILFGNRQRQPRPVPRTVGAPNGRHLPFSDAIGKNR